MNLLSIFIKVDFKNDTINKIIRPFDLSLSGLVMGLV